MWMILFELLKKPLDGIPFTIVFCLSILFDNHFRTERNNHLMIRMPKDRSDGMNVIADFSRL